MYQSCNTIRRADDNVEINFLKCSNQKRPPLLRIYWNSLETSLALSCILGKREMEPESALHISYDSAVEESYPQSWSSKVLCLSNSVSELVSP